MREEENLAGEFGALRERGFVFIDFRSEDEDGSGFFPTGEVVEVCFLVEAFVEIFRFLGTKEDEDAIGHVLAEFFAPFGEFRGHSGPTESGGQLENDEDSEECASQALSITGSGGYRSARVVQYKMILKGDLKRE